MWPARLHAHDCFGMAKPASSRKAQQSLSETLRLKGPNAHPKSPTVFVQAAVPLAQGVANFESIMEALKVTLRDEHCCYSRVRRAGRLLHGVSQATASPLQPCLKPCNTRFCTPA